MSFKIQYTYDSRDHLKALTAHQRKVVLDTVDTQLTHEPQVETRNRKPLRPNPVAPWEIRVGDLRVYYDIDVDDQVVVVIAVGVKKHNRIRIGDEEIEL